MRVRFLLIGLIFISSTCGADKLWCSGTISNIYIDSSNNVMIKGSWRNSYTGICKTDGTGGIDTVTCSLWFSTAVSSMTHDKSVTLMYTDQESSMDCANIPVYPDTPNPYYLMLDR